ncbi:hypothetical protein P5673_022339 [Acropora cervicornis]|uniref:DUF5641 domain-containing protein n=1 Tax=Acropora cervicornis TaxID=6130 RepID=A0AAD9Q6P8_ACRCE|nr:hypothetical protein P5673_022339 [Acropora cervicornis]
MLISQINSVNDPLGLAGLFTVRAKILMRHIWGSDRKLEWDDPIPEENKENWITFFTDLQDMNQIRFLRYCTCYDAKTFLRIQHIRCHKNRKNTRRNKLNRLVLDREQTQYRLLYHERNPKSSLKNTTNDLTPHDVEKAELLWIREAQQNMGKDIENGKYKRLCQKMREDGVYVIRERSELWMEMNYNKREVIFLPYDHPFSCLFVEHKHRIGHHGVLTKASKVSTRYWIPKLLKLVKSIKSKCVIWRKPDKRVSEQGIDLFGHYRILDKVKKRTTSETYGVIFTCLVKRAVYLDIAADYGTDKILMVLRRFVSLHGYYPLSYSQIMLSNITKNWDWNKLKGFSVTEGFEWIFTSADAPWQNGETEALIRSVKRAINASIDDSIVTFSELQTVLYEVANSLNERPIRRHPTSPDDGACLCPNDPLLGRATSRVPSGPFDEKANNRQQFTFVQTIISTFWKKWRRDYFPSSLIRQKWHPSHRNMKTGDIVLIEDSNLIGGHWMLRLVSNSYPGTDRKVRKVDEQYKHLNAHEPTA